MRSFSAYLRASGAVPVPLEEMEGGVSRDEEGGRQEAQEVHL